jgi:hypothetical protein
MGNHTAAAKAVRTAERALAVALLTLGVGASFARAEDACLANGTPCTSKAQCCYNSSCADEPYNSGSPSFLAVCQPAYPPECTTDADCPFPSHCIDNPNPNDLEENAPLRYCVR